MRKYLPETAQLASSTKNTLFAKTIQRILDALEDIKETNKSKEEQNNIFKTNNIIALIGKRGSGKTSILNALLKEIADNKQDLIYSLKKPINPDSFRGESSILQLLISYLFKEITNSSNSENYMVGELHKMLEEVNEIVQFEYNSKTKEFYEDQLDNIVDFSKLYNLEEKLEQLIDAFLKYKSLSSSPKEPLKYLLVAIDDFDIAPDKIALSVSQIINYLNISNLILIVSYDKEMLTDILRKELKERYSGLSKEDVADTIANSILEKFVSPRREILIETGETLTSLYRDALSNFFTSNKDAKLGTPDSIRNTNQQINLSIANGDVELTESIADLKVLKEYEPRYFEIKLDLLERIYKLDALTKISMNWKDYIYPITSNKTINLSVIHNRLRLASTGKQEYYLSRLKPFLYYGLSDIEVKEGSSFYFKRSVFDLIRYINPYSCFDIANSFYYALRDNDFNSFRSLCEHNYKNTNRIINLSKFEFIHEIMSDDFDDVISNAKSALNIINNRGKRITEKDNDKASKFKNWILKKKEADTLRYYFYNNDLESALRFIDSKYIEGNEDFANMIEKFIARVVDVRE